MTLRRLSEQASHFSQPMPAWRLYESRVHWSQRGPVTKGRQRHWPEVVSQEPSREPSGLQSQDLQPAAES